jgi:histidyl-tRNA synthetase
LDDKVDGQKKFVKNAPTIMSFLSEKEIVEWNKFISLLHKFNIKYTINKNLVRGLDYYTNFVYEIISTSKKLSGQSTLFGGGRYGKLISEFGGIDKSCVGCAAGISRIILAADDENIKLIDNFNINIVIAPLNEDFFQYSIEILNTLRERNVSATCNFNFAKLNKTFNYSKQVGAKFVLIIGDKEINEKTFLIKNQINGEQKKIKSINELVKYINS